MSEKTNLNKVKLHDSTIAHIVKLIQLGLLQGLDVVDYFRQIEMNVDESGSLFLDEDYEKRHEEEIESLMASIKSYPSEEAQSEDSE